MKGAIDRFFRSPVAKKLNTSPKGKKIICDILCCALQTQNILILNENHTVLDDRSNMYLKLSDRERLLSNKVNQCKHDYTYKIGDYLMKNVGTTIVIKYR